MRVRTSRAALGGLAAALLLTVVTAPPAHALPSPVDAGPLFNIEVSGDLACRVDHELEYPDTSFMGFNGCGTMLSVDQPHGDARLFAPGMSYPAPAPREGWTWVATAPWTGAGTTASPRTTTTVVRAGDTGLTVREVDTYVYGEEHYRTDVTITAGSAPHSGVLYRAGICFNWGHPRVDPPSVPHPAAACDRDATPGGPRTAWVDASGGAHRMAGPVGDVWARVAARQPFTDTCVCVPGSFTTAGISWAWALAPHHSVTFSHWTDFGGDRDLAGTGTATPASVEPGEQVTFSVGLSNPNRHPVVASTITDQLGGLTYVAGSTVGAHEPAVSGSTLRWTGPWNVPARGSLLLTFRATAGTAPGFPQSRIGGTSPTATIRQGSAPLAVLWRTALAAEPLAVEPAAAAEPGQRVLRFRARLTRAGTGAPIANESVLIKAGSVTVCGGPTDAAGWATCTAPASAAPAEGQGWYRAHYPRNVYAWQNWEPILYEESWDDVPPA